MYVLYVSSFLIFLYSIYKCVFKSNTTNKIEKFDYEKDYDFYINNIKFYKDNQCVEIISYEKEYNLQKKIELNTNFLYDFYVVDYYYNLYNYKFLSDNSILSFPIYTKEQIKNYVYINKIKYAKLKIYSNESTESESNESNKTSPPSQFTPKNKKKIIYKLIK